MHFLLQLVQSVVILLIYSPCYGWLEIAGLENESKNRGWNLKDWKMTDNVAGVEFAGLENDRLENDGLENDGLENDGLEQ